MRLPSLERDYWTLRSGEAQYKQSPKTFWIPLAHDRNNLKIGQAAKLIFDIEVLREDGVIEICGERMWVIVSEIVDDGYIGILDNPPVSFEPSADIYLCFGAEIPFKAEHIVDIANPPEEYVEWQLGQAPERKWPRT